MADSISNKRLSPGKRLLFAGLAVMLVLLFIEGVFSVYDYYALAEDQTAKARKEENFTWPFQSIHELKPGSGVLYGLRPNSKAYFRLNREEFLEYAINSQGFRDKEYSLNKPPNVKRVAVLGDSITFGFEVPMEHSYPKAMESILNGGEAKFEVLNFGVGGYSPYNELALLQETVLKYKPDIVVLGFCMNDVDNPYMEFTPHTLETLGEMPEEVFPNPIMAAKPSFAIRVGQSLGLYSHAIRNLQSWLAKRRESASALKAEANFTLHYKNCLEALSNTGSPEWAWLGEKLTKMNEICRTNNAKFVMAVFPLYYQLDKRYAFRSSRETIMEFCRQKSIPAVDLYETLENYALDTRQVIFIDLIHPNEMGHRLAAQAIVNRIESLFLTANTKFSSAKNQKEEQYADARRD